MLGRILSELRYLESERCGIIGSAAGDRIDRFLADESALSCRYNCRFSRQIQMEANRWMKEGIRFLGIVHSHPARSPQLSPSDVKYASLLLNRNQMSEILMGVVSDNALHIYAVSAHSEGVKELNLEIHHR